MVYALGEGGFRRAPQREVPFEEVGFEGCCCVVWGWGGGELGCFFYCLLGFGQYIFDGLEGVIVVYVHMRLIVGDLELKVEVAMMAGDV